MVRPMKELVEFIVKNLVDNPDDVAVTTVDEGNCLVIKTKVNPADMGKVIGKNGKVANSIRMVVRSIARKKDEHVVVKFDEN